MRLLTLLFAGMSLGSVPLCGQTVDVHTHIIIPEYVEMLKAYGAELEETFPLPVWDANLQRLKQTLASDEELAPYSEDILWKNAERLFEGNAIDER